MPIKRIIVDPPKEMTKESVRMAAEMIYESLHGMDESAKAYLPLTRPISSQGDNESVKRDDWNAELRNKLSAGELTGEFAGPDQSFPITDANDVKDAWSLAGHADNPDQVRANIIRIAKSFGWESGLPAAAEKFGEAEE